VHNTGSVALGDLAVQVTGALAVDRPDTHILGTGPPGSTLPFSFHVRGNERGQQVPVHINVSYTDAAGRRHTRHETHAFQVGAGHHQASAVPESPEVVRILYLSANPVDTVRLGVDRELREIHQELRLGRLRDGFVLHSRAAVRIREISQALLDVEPRIVHFSGHGDGGDLYLEAEGGGSQVLTADGLAGWFEIRTVECVIVNACHSDALARTVARHVAYVIGMRTEIGDQASIAFSIGFYQALAAGRPIPEAFRYGRAQILARPPTCSDHDAPILLARSATSQSLPT
jgi:hypothetical protein